MTDAIFDQVRLHIATFRYFHEVTKEFKDWGALLKGPATPHWRSLLGFLAELTQAGDVTTTANWLDKSTYRSSRGPHLGPGADTAKFRNFQLRRLLERHKTRRGWTSDVDIVLDRWSMSVAQRRNLEDYIRGNWRLRPIGDVTTVSSSYVDSVQIVDLYARLARRVIEGKAGPAEVDWCDKLMDLKEVKGGLY